MVNFQNKQIFYTLNEYQTNYSLILKEYLNQHEDFDELMFLEIEIQFYNLCHDNSNVVIDDFGNGPEYCINGGHCEILIQEINEAISYSEGYDVVLSTKFKASFSKIIKFLVDKKTNAVTSNSNLYTVVDKDIYNSGTYNDNLKNDPLHNPKNEYRILKSKFIEDYLLRTASLEDEENLFMHDFDDDFEYWESTQKEEIINSFFKVTKELNQQKIFFFGCSFDNYKLNYDKRLNKFLEYFVDANEYDFIEDELRFLETILNDIEDTKAAHADHPQSGYDNFTKACEFIKISGYRQYFYSHNKKETFLNQKIIELIQKEKNTDITIENNDIPFNLLIAEVNNENILVDKEEENNRMYLKSTIEDYLEEFNPDINGDGYEILVNALFEYFTNGKFPVLENKIKFKKINKKRVGWALKELYKSEKTDNLEIEYFRFAQENINLFEREVIVSVNFNKSNFYKAFTSNPAK